MRGESLAVQKKVVPLWRFHSEEYYDTRRDDGEGFDA